MKRGEGELYSTITLMLREEEHAFLWVGSCGGLYIYP